ncbi:50S ribosomal protein L19e [Candidatus Woesearchaeota archaeon]|nr:50S ribosomal protein L19e [Candidatus Woesearchaeota archaeon]
MSTLTYQRRLASSLLGTGLDRIWFDSVALGEIKEAITRDDVKRLIRTGLIRVKPAMGISRGRARIQQRQKRKGRGVGSGSRKGAAGARSHFKTVWTSKIRLQRALFRQLYQKKYITKETYLLLRTKAKGGYFRSERHIKLFLTEHHLWLTNGKK